MIGIRILKNGEEIDTNGSLVAVAGDVMDMVV